MGDDHLNTISATKSDEFLKSSVENLVPNLSESEGKNGCDVPACFTTFSNVLFDADYEFDSSDDQSLYDEDVPEKIFLNPLFEEEIIPMKIDQHQDNAESDLVESLYTHDSSLIILSKIDSLLDEFASKLTLLKSIPPGIDETDCNPEEDIRFIERLLYDNSSPRPPEEFEKSPDLLSHQGLKNFQPSIECPMMIHGKNIPILDVPLFHFYPLDQLNILGNLKTLAKGFCPPSLHFLSFILGIHLLHLAGSQPMLKSSYKAEASVIISIPPLVEGSNDPPLSRGHTLGSSEDGIELIKEWKETCSKLSERVLALEESKSAQDLVITILKLRVKKLEKKIKARTPQSTKRRLFKVRVESSAKENLDEEDPSKKRRSMIEEIDQDAGVTLVQVNAKDQGGFDDETNFDADFYKVQVTPTKTYTIRRRAVSTGSGGVSIASRLFSTAEELVSTSSASMPVSTAGMVQEVNISIPSPVVVKDKGKCKMEEYKDEKTKRTKLQQEQDRLGHEAAENIRARVEVDEEQTQRLQAEERNKYSEVDQAKMLVDLINQRKSYFALKKLSFDEIKELFETTIKIVNTFVSMETKVRGKASELVAGSSQATITDSTEVESSKRAAEAELDHEGSKRNVISLKLTVDHPNGIVANVTYVGSHKLSDTFVLHDVSVVPEYHEPYDEERDLNKGDGTNTDFATHVVDVAVTPDSIDITSDVSPKS
nr:hypothetical protein [Tanacetum cinerariifolium]